MPRHDSKIPNKSFVNEPRTILEAWALLAVAVLINAIEDVRQDRSEEKRTQAKEWLMSPAAHFMFVSVMDYSIDFDLEKWVMNNCPIIEN